VPAGAPLQFVLAPGRARRRVFRVAGTGARRVGARAANLLLLFPCRVAAAGDECGGLGPACRWCVFLGACLP
jgi:hypothetical protein